MALLGSRVDCLARVDPSPPLLLCLKHFLQTRDLRIKCKQRYKLHIAFLRNVERAVTLLLKLFSDSPLRDISDMLGSPLLEIV